jgi:hypothetical protein
MFGNELCEAEAKILFIAQITVQLPPAFNGTGFVAINVKNGNVFT